MDKNVLKQCIVQCLKEKQVKTFLSIDFKGTTGKTDGYLADIIFTTIKFINSNDEEEEKHLAVKTGKCNATIRELGFDLLYKQELIFYSKILPGLKTFEQQKQVKNVFNGIPKCYKTFLLKDNELIVMEDLKQCGYVMPDRRIPLSYLHLKLLLQEFGKFHAISFAYYHQRKEEFDRLVSNLHPMLYASFNEHETTAMFDLTLKNALKILQDRNESELFEKLCKYLEKGVLEDIRKLITENTSYKVISHRDSWNNNFMFNYKNNTEPSNALIIDWQMVDITNSPVYDLSHLLYTCSPVEELENLIDLLKIYYESFSEHLKDMGSDPNELFSFATLKDHWRKFSKCGFVYVPYVIKQCYWKDEDAPTIETCTEHWGEAANRIIIEDENYYTRLIGIIKHFLNFKIT